MVGRVEKNISGVKIDSNAQTQDIQIFVMCGRVLVGSVLKSSSLRSFRIFNNNRRHKVTVAGYVIQARNTCACGRMKKSAFYGLRCMCIDEARSTANLMAAQPIHFTLKVERIMHTILAK